MNRKKLILCMSVLFLLGIATANATIIIGGTAAIRNQTMKLLLDHNATQYVGRIDFQNYENKYFAGFAWYKARRISLYRNGWNTTTVNATILHEVGHLYCEAHHLNKYNYEWNEACADKYRDEQLQQAPT